MSGEHGFIVFTLGTVMSEMPAEITSAFLEAFRQIPQKVVASINTHVHSIFFNHPQILPQYMTLSSA